MGSDNPNSNPDRPFWGQSRPTGPASGPEGPVTDQGSSGPGYYQTRGVGNKTGRTSPRQQMRASSRDLTLAKHGLIDQGAADPNQGQMFDADKVVGPRRSDEQIISDQGINMPTSIHHEKSTSKGPSTSPLKFGAARGFLPNLTNKQKVSALEATQVGRVQSGTHRGGGATAEIMQDREAVRSRADNQPWYSGVDAQGNNDVNIQGAAHRAIEDRATRSGVSHGAMTRAAALTSPQSAWDVGVPGSSDHSMPNLSHAESTSRAAESVARSGGTREDAMEAGAAVPTLQGGLPTMGAKAAGVHHDNRNNASLPWSVKSNKSLKAPNFEASLHLSDSAPAARRMAAQSFTVDRHDANAAGVGGSKVLEDRVGVYDVLAMTGTRVAHKNRSLAPNEQAREWVGQRGTNQLEDSHQGMLTTGAGATPQPRQDLVTGAGGSQSRGQRRSATAERLGLEF